MANPWTRYVVGEPDAPITADGASPVGVWMLPTERTSPGGERPRERGRSIQAARPYSGISANVHSEPPVGTLSITKRGATAPPSPDAIDTYCWPLWV
jgi:hypothetical protein